MSMTEEQEPEPSRRPLWGKTPKKSACISCGDPDLRPLLIPPPVHNRESSSSSAPSVDVAAIEEQQSVFVPGFSLRIAKKESNDCALCSILVECARRSGEEGERLKNVLCCIRPKFHWSATATAPSNRPSQRPPPELPPYPYQVAADTSKHVPLPGIPPSPLYTPSGYVLGWEGMGDMRPWTDPTCHSFRGAANNPWPPHLASAQRSGDHGSETSALRLEHLGQLHVKFYETKQYSKKLDSYGPSRADPGAGSSSRPEPESESQFEPQPDPDPDLESGSDSGSGSDFDVISNASSCFEDLLTSRPVFPNRRSPSPARASPQPKAQHESIKVQSPVASWMIDVVRPYDTFDKRRHAIKPDINFDFLEKWTLDCCKGSLDLDHTEHHHPGEDPRAFRALVGVQRNLVPRGVFRLINTRTGHVKTMDDPRDLKITFAALSYVWGPQSDHNPEQGHDRQSGLDPTAPGRLAEYPPTIRDAAELARRLGVDWIWVDRICIDQKNDAEKELLIPWINHIFTAAKFTIVAASGGDVNRGLPGTSGTLRKQEAETQIDCGGLGSFQLLPQTPSFNALMNSCDWRTRGWTFQEQVFSRRIIYVFPSEIIFSCCKGMHRESLGTKFSPGVAGSHWGDGGASPPIFASLMQAKIAQGTTTVTRQNTILSANEFANCLEEYTSRNLTIERDRVRAFAGLVNMVNGWREGALKHGHPLVFFEMTLTWQHDTNQPQRISTSDKPFAPTWSWASAGTKVRLLNKNPGLHLQDNGQEYDWNCRFEYRNLSNQDILGLPTSNFKTFEVLPPDGSDELVQLEPWTHNLGHKPELDPQSETALPVLHLVTAVFDGIFQARGEGSHALWPANTNIASLRDQWGPRLSGDWSVRAHNDATPAMATVEERKPIFAIVGGDSNTYIMALRKAGEDGVYSRLGMFRATEYQNFVLKTVLQQGSPRWEYIRII